MTAIQLIRHISCYEKMYILGVPCCTFPGYMYMYLEILYYHTYYACITKDWGKNLNRFVASLKVTLLCDS